MTIIIEDTKGLTKNPFVVEIVCKVQANPRIFKYISRIFSDYKTTNKELKSEVFSYIERIMASPKLGLKSSVASSLGDAIKDIYELDPEEFSIVRGKILENVVYYLGPVTMGLKRSSVYIEPVLKESDLIIGESDIKCDLVFFQSELLPMEFVECKADIGNMIPKTLPFEMAKAPHQNKIEYLDKVYYFLKNNYREPFIYFACFNLNYRMELKNLQENWGYRHLRFVNPEEIVNGKVV